MILVIPWFSYEMCNCLATKLRTNSAVFRLFVFVTTANLFVGSLRGEKVSILGQNVTTTKDVYNRNDNFRSRNPDYDDINEIYDGNTYLRLNMDSEFTNNHRKSLFARGIVEEPTAEFSSSWAIRLPPHLHDDSFNVIRNIADQLKLELHGSIGHLKGHYLLVHNSFFDPSKHTNKTLKNELHRAVNKKLRFHPHVEWFEHEKLLHRKKRSLEFKDEFFPSQWHLVSLFC